MTSERQIPVRPNPNTGGWRSAVVSLESPQFRRVFAGNMAFFLAMQGQSLVRSVIVYDITGSKLALGIVSASVAVTMLLVSPLGGVMADRIERRKLIITAQSAALVAEAAFFGLLITDRLQFWHMVVLGLIMGCVFPMIMPARQAIVVNIVGKRGLGSAMALSMAGMNIMRVIGPAAAGFLIYAIGVEGAYAINLGLYAVALTAMLMVAPVKPPETARDVSILTNMLDGARYVRSNKIVGILLLYGLVPMFLVMPFQTLLVVFAKDIWETGTVGLGILNAAAGTGGIAGSFYVAWRGESNRRMKLMAFSVVSFGILLSLFSMSPYFYPAVVLIFSANIFASIFQTLNNTAIQLLVSDEVRGRISSFLMMSFSLPLLGTLPLSLAAESLGVNVAVGGASVLAVIAALLFHYFSPSLRDLDATVKAATEQD